MAWSNGYIPEAELIIFKRGYNPVDGNWFWGLTPATYVRHLNLVALAKKRTGRDLSPGDGWSTYRPYAAQVIARGIYGNGAAWPGTSSHGGYWEGQETLAIDYSNWSWVYNGNRAAFYEDCRAVGMSPGQIEPSRGYPDEPWHVIDKNPRSGPGPADVKRKGLFKYMSEDEEREILAAVRETRKRVRGDNPDADILQEIRQRSTEARDRLRGDNPKYDIPQDIQGQLKVIRAQLDALGEIVSSLDPQAK